MRKLGAAEARRKYTIKRKGAKALREGKQPIGREAIDKFRHGSNQGNTGVKCLYS
jgi:hypothetical protein